MKARWDTGQRRVYLTRTHAASSTHGYLTGGLKLENSICEATALMTAVPGAGIGSSRDILKLDFHFRHLARRADLGTARCLWHTRSMTSRDCILCPHSVIQYSGLTLYFSYVASVILLICNIPMRFVFLRFPFRSACQRSMKYGFTWSFLASVIDRLRLPLSTCNACVTCRSYVEGILRSTLGSVPVKPKG